MGINVTHVKDILLADGVNRVFPFTFPVCDKADVKCTYVLPSGEERDLMSTEYDVKLSDVGGEVTYPLTGDALAEGCKLVIYRETPRTTDYNPQNTMTFDAETISKEIERLIMENQEQDEKLSRAVSTSIGSGADPKEYLDNVNSLLVNARELQETAVETCEKTLDETIRHETAAAESASNAASSAASSAEQAAIAERWAIGDIAAEPGGSSKYWAEYAEQVTHQNLNQTQISNCILSYPNNINYELINGVLTVKAGSVVYVPNGKNIYTPVTLANNLELSSLGSFTGTAYIMTFNSFAAMSLSYATTNLDSGTATPTSSNKIYYNSNTNSIRHFSTDPANETSDWSFPFLQVTVQNGVIKSIDKVFSYITFIGHFLFIIPGLTGLIANGLNPNGTFQNLFYNQAKVSSREFTWNVTSGQKLVIHSSGVIGSTANLDRFYEQDSAPALSNNSFWLNTATNTLYYSDATASSWMKSLAIYIGDVYGDSTGKIATVDVRPTFRALDFSSFKNISVPRLLALAAQQSAPIPVDGNKTGQWVFITTSTNNNQAQEKAQLPPGGTWAWFGVTCNAFNGIFQEGMAGVNAGGYLIPVTYRFFGFAWRIQ